MVDLNLLLSKFRELYGREAKLYRAPGRVNLIGEHTDYNDGFVLPIAIDRETVVAAAARPDRVIRVHSTRFGETMEFNLDEPGNPMRGHWVDYVEGTARVLCGEGLPVGGADLVIDSTVSLGGGLSSSAALEVSVGTALLALSGLTMELKRLALAGQKAEHTYVGTKCGIMDQFIATMGKKDHALLIDCRSMEGTLVPLQLGGSVVMVCDTRVKHSLASSEYNKRRGECEQGIRLLREVLPGIKALRDVSPEELQNHQGLLPESVHRRCRHVITENHRTVEATQALRSGRIDEMGRLMNASHQSLSRDYEVSCSELDLIVELARAVPGVSGSRMTGGGFGGCTVSLVESSAVGRFEEEVSEKYEKATGIKPEIFPVQASDGACALAG